MSSMLRVVPNPMWTTVQGEGLYTGEPSVFLRLAGCDLRCDFCDTQQSLPDYDPQTKLFVLPPIHGQDWETSQISAELLDRLSPGMALVVTGGEPMLQQEALVDVFEQLYPKIARYLFVTIETNAETAPTVGLASWIGLASLSPKPYRWREDKAKICRTITAWKALARCQLKIVAGSEEDLEAAIEIVDYARPSSWMAVQIEAGWLRNGWLPKERRGPWLQRLAQEGIRLVAQMHPVLKLR